MSRGIIGVATYQNFLNGELLINVPQGYTRIQFNQFIAGGEKFGVNHFQGVWGWIKSGKNNDINVVFDETAPIYINQTTPIGATYSPKPELSLVLKVHCIGIDAESNIVAAASVGETIQLGMNGNPYKITNKTLKIYITNELDQLVNNLGIILQYTLL